MITQQNVMNVVKGTLMSSAVSSFPALFALYGMYYFGAASAPFLLTVAAIESFMCLVINATGHSLREWHLISEEAALVEARARIMAESSAPQFQAQNTNANENKEKDTLDQLEERAIEEAKTLEIELSGLQEAHHLVEKKKSSYDFSRLLSGISSIFSIKSSENPTEEEQKTSEAQTNFQVL